MQLEAVLLGSGNLCINNGLLLKYSSELGSETRMLTNIMLKVRNSKALHCAIPAVCFSCRADRLTFQPGQLDPLAQLDVHGNFRCEYQLIVLIKYFY